MVLRPLLAPLAALLASLSLSGCVWIKCEGNTVRVLRDGVFRCESPPVPFVETPLVAVVTPSNVEVTTGQQATFVAQAVGGSEDSVWEFKWHVEPGGSPEASTGQAPSFSHTFTELGSYSVIVTVTNNAGKTATAAAAVHVVAPPEEETSTGPQGPPPGENTAPVASFTATPNPAQEGDLVEFDATGSSDADGDPLTYEWDLDGNGVLETGPTSEPTTSNEYAAGTYDVGLHVTDPDGAFDDAAVHLVVTPQALARASARAPRFSARLTLFPILSHPGTTRRRGKLSRTRGAMLLGGFRGRVRGGAPPELASLLDSRWLARVNTITNRRTGATKVRGLALATAKDASGAQTCLRLRLATRRGRRPSGSFRLLGMAGRGKFTLKTSRRGAIKLRGTVRVRGGPSTLPPACSRVEAIRP